MEPPGEANRGGATAIGAGKKGGGTAGAGQRGGGGNGGLDEECTGQSGVGGRSKG